MIANFALASKEQLRNGVQFELLDLNEHEIDFLNHSKHVPAGIVELMYKKLNELKKNGQISHEDLWRLDSNLNGFLECIGACERIKNTPIPYSYSMFFKKFIFVYVTTLPLAFVVNFGYFSALLSTLIFYVLVSLEILAEEIEDPFGVDENDLPTDDMAQGIASITGSILKNDRFNLVDSTNP